FVFALEFAVRNYDPFILIRLYVVLMPLDFFTIPSGECREIFDAFELVASQQVAFSQPREAQPFELVPAWIGIQGVVKIESVYKEVDFCHKNKPSASRQLGPAAWLRHNCWDDARMMTGYGVRFKNIICPCSWLLWSHTFAEKNAPTLAGLGACRMWGRLPGSSLREERLIYASESRSQLATMTGVQSADPCEKAQATRSPPPEVAVLGPFLCVTAKTNPWADCQKFVNNHRSRLSRNMPSASVSCTHGSSVGFVCGCFRGRVTYLRRLQSLF